MYQVSLNGHRRIDLACYYLILFIWQKARPRLLLWPISSYLSVRWRPREFTACVNTKYTLKTY